MDYRQKLIADVERLAEELNPALADSADYEHMTIAQLEELALTYTAILRNRK